MGVGAKHAMNAGCHKRVPHKRARPDGWASAADLKSLHHKRRVRSGAALESISLLVPSFPKFAKVGAATEHELRKVGTRNMVNARNASRHESTAIAPRPPAILTQMACYPGLFAPDGLVNSRCPVVLRPVFARFHKLTCGAGRRDRVRPTRQPSREMATDMAAAPICMSCNLERTLVSIRPTRNRHDVRQYECPKCKSIFRLVVQRVPLDADEVTFETPALKAGAR
jgi:hypothetical protein